MCTACAFVTYLHGHGRAREPMDTRVKHHTAQSSTEWYSAVQYSSGWAPAMPGPGRSVITVCCFFVQSVGLTAVALRWTTHSTAPEPSQSPHSLACGYVCVQIERDAGEGARRGRARIECQPLPSVALRVAHGRRPAVWSTTAGWAYTVVPQRCGVGCVGMRCESAAVATLCCTVRHHVVSRSCRRVLGVPGASQRLNHVHCTYSTARHGVLSIYHGQLFTRYTFGT